MMELNSITRVDNLPDEETEMLHDLVQVWNAKLARNDLRMQYYNGKNRLIDLGISIPPPLRNVETVVGWPAKAVDALAVRSRFDGFTVESEEGSVLSETIAANRFKIEYAQAVTSELISSCAFLTVSRGEEGEPGAIISAYSALNASAIWDDRHKRIKCGLAVIDVKRDPVTGYAEPVWVNLYTDTDVWEIVKSDFGWSATRHPHEMGRPMMEPLVYCPSLDRPFGKSRISRAVMSITDSAVRAALRSEVSSEFFTAPQKYILGADDSIFENTPKWEAYIGNWLALSKDGDGEVPGVGQLPQGSIQPHTDYMRSLAARFAGETSVPIHELGVISDNNPTSAEAIIAVNESLIIEAETLNETNGEALKTIAMMAIACEQNKSLSDLTDEEKSVRPRFKNPARPSVVSQADAIVKVISVMPWVAESTVALEEFGFSDDQITRLLADRDAYKAEQMLQQALEQAASASSGETEETKETETTETAETTETTDETETVEE